MATHRSPFPGMDPWLEQHWADMHHRVVTYAADQIQGRLPGDLRARVEERVFLESPGLWRRIIAPDVRIDERRAPAPRAPQSLASGNGGGLAVAEPILIPVISEPVTEGYVEIRETSPSRRLVTVIEVLSPSNKWAGDGQDQYKRKQSEVTRGGANLVEIDLLRRGEFILNVPKEKVPAVMHRGYKVCVTRVDPPTGYEFYPLSPRQRLPAIRIPLRSSDQDVPLDLQALIDLAYANGGYDDIDYAQDPEPALDEEAAAWANGVLKAAGRR